MPRTRPLQNEESLGAMKKTKLTRSLLAACSIVALSAVMYGCSSGPSQDEYDAAKAETAAAEAEAEEARMGQADAEAETEEARMGQADAEADAADAADAQAAAEADADAARLDQAAADAKAEEERIAREQAEADADAARLDQAAADAKAEEERIAREQAEADRITAQEEAKALEEAAADAAAEAAKAMAEALYDTLEADVLGDDSDVVIDTVVADNDIIATDLDQTTVTATPVIKATSGEPVEVEITVVDELSANGATIMLAPAFAVAEEGMADGIDSDKWSGTLLERETKNEKDLMTVYTNIDSTRQRGVRGRVHFVGRRIPHSQQSPHFDVGGRRR